MFAQRVAVLGPRRPAWVSAGAAAHIQPYTGRSWVNGIERSTWADLLASAAATFSRASVQYGLTSAGGFTSFSSGNAAITDLGLLVEAAETTVGNYTKQPGSWGGGTNVTRTTGQSDVFGGSTAVLYTASGGAAQHFGTAGSATVVNLTSYLTYAIVTGLTGGFVQIAQASATFTTGAYCNFDLTGDGAVGTAGGTVTGSGILKLATGRYLIWMIAPASASASGTPNIAFVPTSSATRLQSHDSSHSMTLHACQVAASSRWGSPIDNTTSAATRAATVLTTFVAPRNYTVTVKFGDGTADQTINGVAVTGSGYALPAPLNGRFVSDIIWMPA